MIDRFGTPYTESLHVVERYRLIDYEAAKEAQDRAAREWPRIPGNLDPNYRGKGLQLAFTVEDPAFSPCPGRRPSPICAPRARPGGTYLRENCSTTMTPITTPTRTLTCRRRTSRIFEISIGRRKAGDRQAAMFQFSANAKAKYLLGGILSAAILGAPALGAGNSSSALPNFDGRWARVGMDPELMASGPKPLVNLRRPMDDHTSTGAAIRFLWSAITTIPFSSRLPPSGKQGRRAFGRREDQSRPLQSMCALFAALCFHDSARRAVRSEERRNRHSVSAGRSNPPCADECRASPQGDPSAMGDSVGHYEGDTLVIDMVGVRSDGSPWWTVTARRRARPYILSTLPAHRLSYPRKGDDPS